MWRLSSLSAALSRAIRCVAWALLAIVAAGCESLPPGASPACAPEPSGAIASGPPRHIADDALVIDHETVSVTGRFASANVRVCAYTRTDGVRWVLRGEGRSSAWGWVLVALSPIANPGDYPVRLEMPQDGTGAEATIFVRAKGTHLAVFDVDGTLTQSEVWPAFLQGYLAEPRPFGVDLAETLRERGCLIVYLTARTHEMTDATRMWREHWRFPRGVVHLSRSPLGLTGPRAAEFKRRFLEAARGAEGPGGPRFIVDFAFGNRPSDLAAYRAAAPTATIYLMDYVAAKDESKESTGYRVVYHTWKDAVDKVRELPAARPCR
jgi:hypothetical protein